MGQVEQAFNVFWVAGQACGFFTDTAVSGHAEHLGDASGLAQLPHQRVLPATIADYQYLHEANAVDYPTLLREAGAISLPGLV